VVIIDHSAGGWIVAGCPGEYHDVAAIIRADIDRSNEQPPPASRSSGAQDTTEPPVDADAYCAFHKQRCGWDVREVLLPHTAHRFTVHQPLPVWANDVVDWLSTSGLRPVRRDPPVPCIECVAPFVR
jgi:hypothetical protein